MRSVFRIFILASFFLLIASACAGKAQPSPVEPAQPSPQPSEINTSIRLKDGLGNVIELAQPAERIVSLAPSNTEILFALGAGAQVVGRDSFSDYPPEAAQVQDVGGGFGKLDVEKILALQPDLILASELTAAEQVQALQAVGLKVFLLPNPLDFDGLYINLLTVATLTGKTPQAKELITTLKARVNAVEAKVSQVQARPLVFYEIDSTEPNAPWTAGPDTFVDTLITLAGGENLGHSLQGQWVQVSIEELIRLDPDLILLGDATWGGVTVEAVSSRSGWEKLSAVINGKVYVFDDNLVSRPGPRLVDGLEAMAALFHAELFR